MQFHYYTAILILSSLMAATLSEFVHLNMTFPGKRPFILLMSLISGWCFFAAMELIAETQETSLFWARLILGANMLFGILFLWFAEEFNHKGLTKIPVWQYTFLLIPVFSIVAALTNGVHGLVWKSCSFDPISRNLLIKYGILYWIIIGIQLLFIVVGMISLFYKTLHQSRTYRKQVVYVLIATVLPIVATAIYMLELTPLRIIPLSVFISVAMIYFGILRFKLFDLVPVARHKLVDKMKGVMLVLDSNNCVRDFNISATKHFGISRQTIGKGIGELIPEMQLLNKTLALSTDVNEELFIAGQGKWYDITITMLGTEENKGTLIILRDITGNKLYETQLAQLNEDLKTLNEQKNKLFSIIAHDLKNPFHQIIGFSEILLQNAKTYSPEEVEETAQILVDASLRGKNILDDLLLWSRSLMHSIQLNPMNLDLASILKHVVRQMEPLANKKGISIKIVAPEGIDVYADRNMFAVVLRNLLGNAIKFSYENETITVSVQVEKSFCIVSIADAGIGIDLPQVGDIFTIDNKSSRTGTKGETGTGLGLAICKEFTEKNGGRISVESSTDQGSKFSFSIPLASETAKPDSEPR